MLGERMVTGGLSNIAPVLAAAGFTRVETGPTRIQLSGTCARGRGAFTISPLPLAAERGMVEQQ
jgi:hypothetical protein